MGDNATASWAWHNTVVGQGYQAKGVIRQPGSKPIKMVEIKKDNLEIQIAVDQDKKPSQSKEPCEENNSDKKSKKKRKHKHGSEDERRDHKDKKEKKEKKEKKHAKKSKKEKKHSVDDISNSVDSFNPLLQFLASSLSNRTRVFSLENE